MSLRYIRTDFAFNIIQIIYHGDIRTLAYPTLSFIPWHIIWFLCFGLFVYISVYLCEGKPPEAARVYDVVTGNTVCSSSSLVAIQR